MNVIQTTLPGVMVLEPKRFGDKRGFFMETYQAKRYHEIGIALNFVQDNLSRSAKGVLRGLHYQLKHPQGKLVAVTTGEVFDVAVDIRQGSPTYGQWYGTILNSDNYRQMYIPPGFAHGFCVLSEYADFQYKCTDYYYPDDETGVLWNDPTIGVEWPIENPILSDRDKVMLSLNNTPSDQLPQYRD